MTAPTSKVEAIAARAVPALVRALRGELLTGGANIPTELKECKGWLVWKVTEIQTTGKFNKIPLYPRTRVNRNGEQGTPGDLKNLGTWDEASAAINADKSLAGVGFALLPQFNVVALDVDHCIKNGELRDDVEPLTGNTYCEISPSGTGVRAFWIGKARGGKNHSSGHELFHENGFVTVTGNRTDNIYQLFGTEKLPALEPDMRAELERLATPSGGVGKVNNTDRLKMSADHDPRLLAIKNAGLYERDMGHGKHSIRCPFEEQHSDAGRQGGDGDTVYMQPRTNDHLHGIIHCSHTHSNDQRAYWETIGYDEQAEGLGDVGADPVAQSDVEIARRAAEMMAGRFVYEHGGRGWMHYVGGVYLPCSRGEEVEIVKRLGVEILKTAQPNTDDVKRTAALAQRVMSAAGVKAALQLAQSDPRLAVQPADFDADPDLLNVQNGVIHLPSGELRSHDPAQFFSRQCPFPYNPAAHAPTWDRFLHQISNDDPDWVDFIQRAVGYSLSGHVNEEVMFFLLGIGANGKSVFCNVMRHLGGDYVGAVPANFLMVSKRDGESATPSLAALVGARFVQANEVEAGARLSAQMVKVATSTDAISARHLYGRQFTFTPTHTLWVRGNHKPIITDNDEGIWRRVVLIPFDRHFTAEEKDTRLEAAIMREAPGVLSWMVRGHLEYLKHGLRRAARVAAASQAYRAESDLVGQWIDEQATRGAGFVWQQRDAYLDYREWCTGQGLHPMAKKSLTTALKERGFNEGQGTTGGRLRLYRGLKSVFSCGFDAEPFTTAAQDAQD